MKKFLVVLLGTVFSGAHAQFNISVESSDSFSPKEVYLYTLSGSKDVLISKVEKNKNQWSFKYPKSYIGMMKAYFPENNYTLNFVSENKDIRLNLLAEGNKVTEVAYGDEANALMNKVQDVQSKRENLLPVFYQIKNFYRPSSEFYKALDKEIEVLATSNLDTAKYPFIDFYTKAYQKFLVEDPKRKVTQEEVIGFFSNASEYLETSGLMRPILIDFLKETEPSALETSIDQLLAAVNLESPRGQTVLSELIEIFDMYSMESLKNKYLAKAQGLTCTINDRLSGTLEQNRKTAVGAIFENYKFENPTNTKEKSIYDIKTDKKVVVFWSSTCSHCETELPKFIPHYKDMKSKNIEIIGFSLDSNKESYEAKAKMYPWINASELKGWYSPVAEKYNVRATPSYFILDKDNKILAKPNRLSEVLDYFGIK